jgi:hypothetical protein
MPVLPSVQCHPIYTYLSCHVLCLPGPPLFQVHSSIAPGHQQHLHTALSFDWTRTWFVVFLPRRISFVNSIHGTVALFDSMHEQRLDHCLLSDHCVFKICLFISPDLDGHRAPKMKYCPCRDPHKVPKPKYEATALHSHPKLGLGFGPLYRLGPFISISTQQ